MYYSLIQKEVVYMYDNNIKNIKLAQEGKEEALEELVKDNSGLVWNIVRRFIGRGV